MISQRLPRLSYENSCRLLQRLGYLDAGNIPLIPDHRPQFDDEEPLGVNFFRTLVGDGDLENLTLPRTYFGRSEIGPLSFKNTDLSESSLCWNDFNKVNCTDADLSECDLRASHFSEMVFVRANLRNADLRHCTFEECDFTDAGMRGSKLTHEQGRQILLSNRQQEEIEWHESDGETPPGG